MPPYYSRTSPTGPSSLWGGPHSSLLALPVSTAGPGSQQGLSNCLLSKRTGASLVVQGLRLCLPVQRVWVQSLVGDLRSYKPRAYSKKIPKPREVKTLSKTAVTKQQRDAPGWPAPEPQASTPCAQQPLGSLALLSCPFPVACWAAGRFTGVWFYTHVLTWRI